MCREGGQRRPDRTQHLGHGSADQIQIADLIDPPGRRTEFPVGQQVLENAAGVRQGYENDIPRIRNIGVGQDSQDPPLRLSGRLGIGDLVSGSPAYPQEAAFLPVQDAALDETSGGAFESVVRLRDRLPDPVTGVVGLGGLHDAGQHGIEQVVPERFRVDHEKPLGIHVYSRFQSEVQQNRPGQRIVTLQYRHTVEGAFRLIEQEEHDLFGQSQGVRRAFTGDVDCLLRTRFPP